MEPILWTLFSCDVDTSGRHPLQTKFAFKPSRNGSRLPPTMQIVYNVAQTDFQKKKAQKRFPKTMKCIR